MAIAGAAFGASKALEDILGEQMLRAKMAQQQQEAAQRMKLDEQRLNESIRQNDLDEKFRGRQEDRVAAGDREKNNTKGVRRMIGEALQQRVPVADMEGMAFAEGIELPKPPTPKLRSVTTRGEKGQPINRMVPETEAVEEYREPKAPARPERDPIADHEAKLKLDAKYKTGAAGPSAYSVERSGRTLQSVDDLMGKISGKTTGWGNLAAGIPASDAMNFASELDTLKANIAFNELTAMREASKTGGALGQVSNIELRLLESALGALNPRQSADNLKEQLAKIRGSIERWQRANGIGNMTPATSGAGGGSPYEQYLARKKGGG